MCVSLDVCGYGASHTIISAQTQTHSHTCERHPQKQQEAVKKVMVYIRPEGMPLPKDGEEGKQRNTHAGTVFRFTDS